MKELIKLIACCLLAFTINLTPGKSYAADPDVRARAAKCPIPEVPEGAKIVFLGLGGVDELTHPID